MAAPRLSLRFGRACGFQGGPVLSCGVKRFKITGLFSVLYCRFLRFERGGCPVLSLGSASGMSVEAHEPHSAERGTCRYLRTGGAGVQTPLF